MSITGTAIDWVEAISDRMDDPEARQAGSTEPFFPVSDEVAVSLDHGLHVYHLGDDQLGTGSSFGNASVWAETKGSGGLLSLFSIETGKKIAGGMSLTYLLPFTPLVDRDGAESHPDAFSRTTPSAVGKIHLHPAFQQHEFVIGDGLHVLETFFVPRTGMDDPASAAQVSLLWNRTAHPTEVIVAACLDPRGETPMDMIARYDSARHALVAWNESEPDQVRVFGASQPPSGYWATTDEEEAYSPRRVFPSTTSERGNLTCALQFRLLLLPGQRHKLRIVVSFSPEGAHKALSIHEIGRSDHLLKHTAAHYSDVVGKAEIEAPDAMVTHAVQWAKTCLLRPIACYPIGMAATNDPGRSSNIVGRDTAWYVHGCDATLPDVACSMLRILADYQREDGLIREYINGLDGKTEDYGFNINDATPLFLMALAHHIKVTGHWDCMRALHESARLAGERILASLDEKGLVKCTAEGIGPGAICGWRNVLQNEQITGAVTEVNCECYAALLSLADLETMEGDQAESARYHREAEKLHTAINQHLLNRKNGLYVRNIDLQGRVFTQATSDLVFPLICGCADEVTSRNVVARLAEQDFMTEAGIRVLPYGNPRYDPSFESGCLGGVWPGVTWWYAMSASKTDPGLLAESLRRAYYHYVSDPRTYNTVPGQFSEWSDGQTLVNRGMRLSPWDSPRFVWSAIEGLAGVTFGINDVALVPHMPPDWLWLRAQRIPYHGGWLGFFLAKECDGMHVYTANSFETELTQHHYEEEISDGLQTITTGVCAAAFRKDEEVLMCLGNSNDQPTVGPMLAHHALGSRKEYDVSHINSHQGAWTEIGVMKGQDLMRVAVPVQAHGYALYRFRER